jgi:hypothetical protein
MGDRRGAYRVSVGETEGRRPVERPGHRWERTINIYLLDVGWEVVDWTYLAQDRDMSQ